MKRQCLMLALVVAAGAVSAWAGTKERLDAAEKALRAKRYAQAEAICAPLARGMSAAGEDKITSAGQRRASRLLVQSRAAAGAANLDEAIALQRTVSADDSRSSSVAAFHEAMRLRNRLAKNDMQGAAAVTERLLAWSAAQNGDCGGASFINVEAMAALMDFHAARYGTQGAERLQGRLGAGDMAAFLYERFARDRVPARALAALSQMARTGMPLEMKPGELVVVVNAAEQGNASEAVLGKRGYYEMLARVIRQASLDERWAKTRDQLNVRATQLAIELRNDQLASGEK